MWRRSYSRPTRFFFYSLWLCAVLLCNIPIDNRVASFEIDFDSFSHMFDMNGDSHQVAHEEAEEQEDFYESMSSRNITHFKMIHSTVV